MGTLTTLKTAALQARKDSVKDKEKAPYASFLALVLSNAQTTAKSKQREVDDSDAENAIRAEVKSLVTLIDGDEGKGLAPLPEGNYRVQSIERRDLLQSLVPGLLEGQELADAINAAAVEADVVVSPAAMGKVMAILKEKYGSRVDGKLVKEALAKGV